MRRTAALFLGAVAAHCTEEVATGFPSWANRRMGGTTTYRWYAASHAVLLPVTVAAVRAGARSPHRSLAAGAATAVAVGFASNAVFHVAGTLRWGERSPGVVTGVLGTAPAGLALAAAVGRGTLTPSQRAAAVVTGLALNGLAVASLTWDAPTLGGPAPGRG